MGDEATPPIDNVEHPVVEEAQPHTEDQQMGSKKKPAAKKKAAPKKAAATNAASKLSARDLKNGGRNKSIQIAVRITESEYQEILADAKKKQAPSLAAHLRTSLGL
jgi:hypothetical protein